MGIIKERRLGCFTVDMRFFEEQEEVHLALFKDFVPWAVDRDGYWLEARLMFVGFHPSFEPVDRASRAPEYKAEITKIEVPVEMEMTHFSVPENEAAFAATKTRTEYQIVFRKKE